MKEIEIKSYLRDKNKVVSNLENLGCILSEPIKQTDTVYARVIGKVEEYLSNDHFVRIREKSDGKFIFTVKGFVGNRRDLVKTEHETEILKPKEMESALFMMGYQMSNKVIKQRQTTTWEEYEICLDDVEELGSFIEVEKVAENDSDHEAVLLDLQKFMLSLGVSDTDSINKGYDIMMVEKMFGK